MGSGLVRHSKAWPLMSALGQKRTLTHLLHMSALPPKADIGTQQRNVRFVPLADIGGVFASNFSEDCPAKD
jgi:hypothetical protein